MGRTVRDLAMLLDVQAGYDARAPLSLNDGAPRFRAAGRSTRRRLRIGWLGDLDGYLAMEPACSRPASRRCARCEGGAVGRAHRRSATTLERVWRRLAGVAALAGGAARWRRTCVTRSTRDLIKPEALWEHDQAQSLTGHRRA